MTGRNLELQSALYEWLAARTSQVDGDEWGHERLRPAVDDLVSLVERIMEGREDAPPVTAGVLTGSFRTAATGLRVVASGPPWEINERPVLLCMHCGTPRYADEACRHERDGLHRPVPELAGAQPARRVEKRVKLCKCQHEAAAHAHYRRGTDCSSCDCTRLRLTWRELFRRR